MTAALLKPLDVWGMLRRECRLAGGQRAWAEAARAKGHKVSESTVSLALQGHREPSAEILAALGLVEVRRYVPVAPAGRDGKAEAVGRSRRGLSPGGAAAVNWQKMREEQR